MEMVMGIFHQTWQGNWLNRFTQGIVRGWFSLELVSFGGELHFYIRAPKFFRSIVEAQIYSQYPEVEIYQADDYVTKVDLNSPGSALDIWGGEWQLSKDDPYPIKTYLDYKLDENPDEEFKIDPITPLIEFFGSIKPTEQLWMQVLIQATKDRYPDPKTWFGKRDWKAEGKDLIEKLMKRDKQPKPDEPLRLEILSPGEREAVAAVERSISKLGFDCGMRTIYLGPKDKFDPVKPVGLRGCMRQFSSQHLNGFKVKKDTTVDFPWQDFRGIRVAYKKKKMFKAYALRGWFYEPFKRKPFVLNTEELATIYHFPGAVARTPTLEKIESKKGEAPINLPL